MKRLKAIFILVSLAIVVMLSGCSNKKAEAAKQAAYEAGMQKGSSTIQKKEIEKKVEHDALANAVKKEKQESVKQGSSNAEGQARQYEGNSGTTYVIDTLNNRVHKHNSGCSLLGAEAGRATVEPWNGTLEEAVAHGYTKCPECVLRLGGGRS